MEISHLVISMSATRDFVEEEDDEVEVQSSSVSLCGGVQVPFSESEKVAIIQALIECSARGIKNAAIYKQVADKLNKEGRVPSREVTWINLSNFHIDI